MIKKIDPPKTEKIMLQELTVRQLARVRQDVAGIVA